MEPQTRTTLPACSNNSAWRMTKPPSSVLSKQHSPLAQGCKLADAPFWDKAQAAFLREEITEDADWAEVVDQLNLMLRG